MEQIAWISTQITIAAAAAFCFGKIAKWLGFGPSYADAPKFYQLCATLGLVFVSAPVTFFVSTFAPILKEKQRAARRRRRAERDFADYVRERGILLATRRQLPRERG
jgi:hypothetical protein